MSFAAFNLLFPIVVAIHNFDEYRGYEDFVRSYPAWLAEKLTRKVVGWAAILLTLAVTALVTCPRNNMAFAVGQLTDFQGANDEHI